MKKNQVTIRSSAAEYLTYVASVGEETQNVEVRYEDENIWLTQKMLGILFNVESHTINYHIKKIFNDNELLENSTTRKFRIVQNEGARTIGRDLIHYNLQMIIAIGFKVNSERAVQSAAYRQGSQSAGHHDLHYPCGNHPRPSLYQSLRQLPSGRPCGRRYERSAVRRRLPAPPAGQQSEVALCTRNQLGTG